MTTLVNKDSANWRLFGGGGMLAGGLLWLIALIVVAAGAGGAITTWLTIIALLALGASGFFLAFGQTGSNGVVGAALLGKLGFIAFGVGWILVGLALLLGAVGVAAPAALTTIGAVLVVLGGIVGLVVAYQKGVARGIARWFFAVPVAISLVWLISVLGWLPAGGEVVVFLLAISYAIAGLLFLLNRR